MPATAAPLVLVFPTRLPAIRLTTDSGAGKPVESWIQVAVVGDYEDQRYGKFSITPEMLDAMVLNFSSGKFPVPPTEICVDYDHLTTKASQVPGDGKAAGWFKALETRDEGTTLWAKVKWTAAGAEAISSQEYRFFSPYFTTNYENQNGDELGPCLINGAITNRPFLQGMQPLSLALSALNHLPKNGLADLNRRGAGGWFNSVFVALTTLTDNDKKARLDTAVQTRFGTFAQDSYGYSCWDTWLVDTIDGRDAVFCKNRRYFIVGYAFADDGSVSFTSDPVEVVNNWARLGSDDGGRELMAKIALKAANGSTVEIDQDQLEQLPFVKELRAKLPAADAKVLTKVEFEVMDASLKTLTAKVDAQATDIAANKEKADKAEKALATNEAQKKVDALITAGKITPAQRPNYVELALSNGEMFTKLTADMPVVVPLNRVTGAGADTAGGSEKAVQLAAKAAEIRAAEPKLTAEQAMAKALDQNQTLYEG